jgi:hypothetical protein
VSLAEALAEALDLDFENLFDDEKRSFEESNRRAAVAGVAYVLARFADDELWDDETTAEWTFETLLRAAAFRGFNDLTFRDSVLSMHPLIFAVHGFAALMTRGYEIEQCQSALLTLAVDPLGAVVEAVATSAKVYAVNYPGFYWVLFGLFLRQCIIEKGALPNYYSPYWDEEEEARNLALLEAAEAAIETGVVSPLPAVPMPWLEREDQRSEDDLDSFGFERNPLCFRWNLAKGTILQAELDVLVALPEQRSQFVMLVEQLVAMTIQEVVPPFAESYRDNRVNTPFEWVFSFFRWLGKVASHLSPIEVERIVLEQLFATDNETALLAMRWFAPSYLAHSLLPPSVITDEAFAIWEKIAEWVIENPEGRRTWDRYVDREFSICVFTLLFCFGGEFQPLVCVIEEGWSPLDRFKPIIERVVRKFGTNHDLYFGLIRFLKKGGLDMTPEPALSWLREIALATKQDQDFWKANGNETVEILKLILAKKAKVLSAAHRDTISFITDILVDNGVRGAGFLQQDQLRQ